MSHVKYSSSLAGSLSVGTDVKGTKAFFTDATISERVAKAFGRVLPFDVVSGVYTYADGSTVKEKTLRFDLKVFDLVGLCATGDGNDRLSAIAEDLKQECILLEWDGEAALHYADGRAHEYIGTACPLQDGETAENYTENADGHRYTFRKA